MSSNNNICAGTVTRQTEKVDKDVADRLNNYAQGLHDPITHVVDYGNLEDSKKKK